MSDSKSGSGIGLLELLGILFVALKLGGIVAWSSWLPLCLLILVLDLFGD